MYREVAQWRHIRRRQKRPVKLRHVMRVVFFSLAAAIVVFVGMLLLTVHNP
jgi:hypothetical protein